MLTSKLKNPFWATSSRNSFKHVLSGAALVLTFALVGAGCGNSGSTGENTASPSNTSTAETSSSMPTTVTIGYNAAIVQPQPLIGLEGDYARDVPGVKFVGKAFAAGPDVIEALRANVVDIGCAGAWPAMRAFAKDGDVVLLSGCAVGGTQLSVKGDSPFRTVKDLKGKIVGVNQLGSTVETMVRAQLVEAGLKPGTDVRLVAVEPADQADALAKGEVDAIAAPAPWPSFAQKTVGARALLNDKQIFNNGNYLAGSLFTTKRFAEAHPEFIKQFQEANTKITEALNQDTAKGQERVLAAWSKASKKTLDPAVARAAFATIRFTTDVNAQGLQDFADLALKVGVLREKANLTGFVVNPR